MTEKDVRKLNRYQLLELLIVQTERADKLQARLDALEAQMENQEYGRYRDTVSDYYTDLNYLTENARYMSETEYQKALDNFNIKYGSHRDAVADDQWQKTFDEGVRQYDEQFKYKQEQDKIANDIALQQLQASLGGGPGDGEGDDGGSSDGEFSGTTFSEAVAYMKKNGVPSARASNILTESEWNHAKAVGSNRYGASDYDSYGEYLADAVAYNIEEYGN